MSSRLEGDVYINGALSAKTFNPPDSTITRNAQIGTTSDPISVSKVQHRHIKTVWLSDHATDGAVKRVVAHVVIGATATIAAFKAGVTVAATLTGAVVVDLKVNGTSVLSSATTLDSANAAFSQEDAAGFTDTDLVAGDVVEVSINSVAGSTLPKGVHATVVIDEMPA